MTMKNEWDDYAENWDVDPLVAEYAEKAFASLKLELLDSGYLKEAASHSSIRALDFGCGTGSLTSLVSPMVKEIVALDASHEMIKYLDSKQLPNVRTISDYLSTELVDTSPLLKEKFDIILTSSVCAFLPNYEETLALLTSLLMNNGVLIQWDWLAESDNSPSGLTENRINTAYENISNLSLAKSLSTPFKLKSPKGELTVVMAVAKKT